MKARDANPKWMAGINRLMAVTSVAVVLAAVVAVAVPLAITATPDFFARYHLLERRYVNLEDSSHEGIGCRSCHETQPLVNGVQLVADFYTSLVSTSPEPTYFSFQPPKNEACLSCHAEEWTSDAASTSRIPHPAHKRVASETRQCTGCHKWTAHFEPYLAKHEEMPFSGVCVAYGCHVGTKQTEQCFDCHHVLHESNEEWRTEHPQVMRVTGQNACLEGCHEVAQCQQCHTTGKRPEFRGRPIEVSMKSIEVLHVRDDWTEVYHGQEALQGRDRCLQCHEDESECGECHLQRPASHGATNLWIGRHSNQTELLDDPACLECHQQVFCEDCHRQFKEME